MQDQLPREFDVWIGGFLGPSYKVQLEGTEIIYEVFERAYEPFATERITPSPKDWSRFLAHLDGCGFWEWQQIYSNDHNNEGTTWYIHIAAGGRNACIRGLNMYPPGFVEFLRAMRGLLNGRQFA